MTSRKYSERIAVEVRGDGEWTELCRRRAAIDSQTMEIRLPQDSTLQGLAHRDTRIRWFLADEERVINLTGIHLTPGRRPEMILQGFSEQFETTDEPTLVDLDGNEAVYET